MRQATGVIVQIILT